MEKEEFERLLTEVQANVADMKEVIDFYKDNKITTEQFNELTDAVGKLQATSKKGSPTGETFDNTVSKEYENSFFSFLKKQTAIPDTQKFSANQSVHRGPEGGYFVPVDVQSEVQRIIKDSSVLSQFCKLYNTDRNTIEIPYEIGGASCGWVGEEQVGQNSSSITFGTKKLVVNKMFANASFTREMLSDSVLDIKSEFTRQLAEKFTISENNGILYGTGTNSPEGLLNKTMGITPKHIDITANASWKDLIMATSDLPQINSRNYRWYMNNRTRTFLRCMVDGTGRNAFNITLDQDGVNMLEGYPITIVPELPSYDSTTAIANADPKKTISILFGSFFDTYAVARNGTMETLEDPYAQKKAGIVEYSTWSRMGGGILRKNQMIAIDTRV